jgi:TrmH family RNA methyltransferase
MLTKITSADNSRVKLVRKLSTRKGRLEERAFTAEGRNLVEEILEKGIKPRFILVSDKCSDEEILRDAVKSDDIMVCELPEKIFAKLTDAEHGIGMLAVVDTPETGLAALESLSADDNILVLDRIQDPGNMGTLIRTSVAAGYKAIVASKGTADVYSTKVLRATVGTVFEVPVVYAKDQSELISFLKNSGKRLAVTEVDKGVPYYEVDLSKGIALVIGNEGAGVSDELKEMADIRVTIPMKGHIESLNAAVAAAILMYESVRDQKR